MEICFASDERDPLEAGDAEHSSQGGGDEDAETKDNMKEVQRQEFIETQENDKCFLEVYARDGTQLLKVAEDDLDWPDEDRTLYPHDVLAFLGIPPDQFCLYDFFPKAASQNQQVQIVECDKQLNFGEAYTIEARSCARCTICKRCCTRKGTHRLCAHGGFEHLWCRPQDHGIKGKCSLIQVEGYVNGSLLDTRFSYHELFEELNGIQDQYAIEMPSHFGLPWRRRVRARLM